MLSQGVLSVRLWLEQERFTVVPCVARPRRVGRVAAIAAASGTPFAKKLMSVIARLRWLCRLWLRVVACRFGSAM